MRFTRTHIAMALALQAGLVGAASAQSTVIIYGFVDMGISKSNNGTTPGSSLPGRGPANVWSVQQGNASRIGFTGKEDLGDGSYARFQIEHRFNPDTGAAASSAFWAGRSVVALGGTRYGEIYLGREYSPAFWVALNADPTLWSYVSMLGAAYTWGNWNGAAPSDASSIRWSNMVGYKTPTFGGLNAEVSTGLGENQRKNSKSANVQYREGAIWAGFGYDGLDSNNRLLMGAGSYDFGSVKLLGSYTNVKGGLNGDAKAWTTSVIVPTSFGRAYAQFGSLDPTGSNNNSKMFGAGAEYNLSKRTFLYANLGTAAKQTFTRTTTFDLGIKAGF
ncbi:porin [Aquabacterium sp.]|uniref:porin n=1 Tax=Aquabacterium sp. TaxID=1872578 RepID=UPI003784789C